MRTVAVILPVLLAGVFTSCTDDGAPPPPPPWAFWTRVPISADLSMAIHPEYVVTHAYNPADTSSWGYAFFSIARRGTDAAGYRSDYSTTCRQSIPSTSYCRFAVDSGFEGFITLTDEPGRWGATVFLQTIDRQRYMSLITFTRYGTPSSFGELEEVQQMAMSLEYR